MSVDIRVENAVKKFGDVTVIPGLDVEIKKGELFTLLGPSGCGKTTLLRMIAGFNTFNNGALYFNGKDVTEMEPAKRNIGMVFQNYAIFPHLSVRKNVEFGLKELKLKKEEIKSRSDKYMKLVHIDHLADRMPSAMSGGQQQRVALARAIAISPDVLLMDEPLSNLDAKLRLEMREMIRELQHDVGITTVYVTHDQEEAMAISDRIAVMNEGVIQQIGTPEELYHRPANEFVANFIGRTNLIHGRLYADGTLNLAGDRLPFPHNVPLKGESEEILASVRPEEFFFNNAGEPGVAGTVQHSTFLGMHTHYLVELGDGEVVQIIKESEYNDILEPGTAVTLGVKLNKINLYKADGSVNICPAGSRGGAHVS